MNRLSAPGKLYLRLALSVFATFVLALCITWCVQDVLSAREVRGLIRSTFEDVRSEIIDVVNERLIRQAMAAREELEEGAPTDTAGMQRLARQLRITELNLVDAHGLIVASTDADYLGFDFRAQKDDSAAFCCLLNSETEYCQPLRKNALDASSRKYVGVWRPEGGFVQIGCDVEALRGLTRSSIVELFENWNVAGAGGIVVTSSSGLVLSDYQHPTRKGTQWHEPDVQEYFWGCEEIEGFPVYIVIPRHYAVVRRNVLVGSSALLNGLSLAFVALLVGVVIAAFVRRQIREQAAKDLKMATDIQLSALPNVFPPFPDQTSFDIYANMKTAKEVGGDFYDFYYTSPNTLAFLIADVSGKGVPAALFMMRAKTLIKSAAQTGKPLAQVATEVNAALCEGNENCMFVTAWIGELNTETGLVTYVNAGHNPPICRRGREVAYLRTRGSMALGAMPGIRYKAQELQLKPGDAIYLYTDGITEQPNAKGELYGEDRLLKVLTGMHYHQQEVAQAVLESVHAHASGEEPADDRTQLLIRYRGPADVHEFSYKPTLEDLAKATADLEQALIDVPMKEQMQLMVAADEIFANIVHHSNATGWTLTVARPHYPAGVQLVFTDDGKPFDPLALRDPDTHLAAEDRTEGGLGILIVKKTMSPVTYKRREGRNILTLGKTFGD